MYFNHLYTFLHEVSYINNDIILIVYDRNLYIFYIQLREYVEFYLHFICKQMSLKWRYFMT